MNVCLYARVSTSRQETENQLAVLREYCSRSGYEIVKVYVDEVSGSGLKVRNQFNLMLNEARTRQFDLVLFWSLDRFTREGALKTLQYLQQLTSYGVGYKSYTEQYLDSAGVFADAIIAIIATLAKQERLRIQERVKAGLARLPIDPATGRRIGKNGNLQGGQTKIIDRERVRTVYQETRSLRKTAEHMQIGKDLVRKLIVKREQEKP